MTKQITSYKELLEEKARLKTLLAEQELLIREDWQLIKEDLQPAVMAATTIRKFFINLHRQAAGWETRLTCCGSALTTNRAKQYESPWL